MITSLVVDRELFKADPVENQRSLPKQIGNQNPMPRHGYHSESWIVSEF